LDQADDRVVRGRTAISAGLEPRSERVPPLPLLAPVQGCQQCIAEGVLGDALAAGRDLEEEDLLLDVGGDEQEVHELGDAGTGEAEAPGEVGVVGELAAIDAALQGVGERELPGDAGRVAALRGGGLLPRAAAGAGGGLKGTTSSVMGRRSPWLQARLGPVARRQGGRDCGRVS
jgi:hypothetical protein